IHQRDEGHRLRPALVNPVGLGAQVGRFALRTPKARWVWVIHQIETEQLGVIDHGPSKRFEFRIDAVTLADPYQPLHAVRKEVQFVPARYVRDVETRLGRKKISLCVEIRIWREVLDAPLLRPFRPRRRANRRDASQSEYDEPPMAP